MSDRRFRLDLAAFVLLRRRPARRPVRPRPRCSQRRPRPSASRAAQSARPAGGVAGSVSLRCAGRRRLPAAGQLVRAGRAAVCAPHLAALGGAAAGWLVLLPTAAAAAELAGLRWPNYSPLPERGGPLGAWLALALRESLRSARPGACRSAAHPRRIAAEPRFRSCCALQDRLVCRFGCRCLSAAHSPLVAAAARRRRPSPIPPRRPTSRRRPKLPSSRAARRPPRSAGGRPRPSRSTITIRRAGVRRATSTCADTPRRRASRTPSASPITSCRR